MKLLGGEEVKTMADQKESERIARVKKLNAAEIESAKRLNRALEKERETDLMVKKTVSERDAIAAVKKTVLEQEVAALESRKQAALVPIDAQKKEASELLERAKEAANSAERMREKFTHDLSLLEDRLDSVSERETKAQDTQDALLRREAGITASESEIKRSTEELGKKWLVYHTQSTEFVNFQKSVILDKAETDARRKANEAVSEELALERERIRKEDIAVRDKYVALAQAKKHLGIND